jgi:hypothetical protein
MAKFYYFCKKHKKYNIYQTELGKSSGRKQKPIKKERKKLLQTKTTGEWERIIQIFGSCIHSYKRHGGLFDFPIHHFQAMSLISSTTAISSAVPLSKIILFL